MSYCRLNKKDSDLYVYEHILGRLECCGCRLGIEENAYPGGFQTKSRREMLEHMIKHEEAGHKVPLYAINRMEKHLNEFGDIIE